jgi:hypothetical protein
MLHSLRGLLTPREGVGQLPALLLDLGPPPVQTTVERQEEPSQERREKGYVRMKVGPSQKGVSDGRERS